MIILTASIRMLWSIFIGFYDWKDWRQQECCWEIKADKNGKIVSRGEYYEQGNKVIPGRAIQPGGRKLPGAE